MLSHSADGEILQPRSATAGQETAVADLQHTHNVAAAGLSHTEFPLGSATLPSAHRHLR